VGDVLRAKVDSDWVEEGVGDEVREEKHKVILRHFRDVHVLSKYEEDFGHVEPQE